MAFTFGQLYQKAMVIFDKSGSPYMPQDQFDTFANLKYNAWVDYECRMLESDERYTADLMYLFTTFSKANSNTIDQTLDVPTFYKLLRFNMTYHDPCDPQGTNRMSKIYPATNDEIDDMLNDSFSKPTDKQPASVVTQLASGNPGWFVHSTTTPLTLNMTFTREPQIIDSANNPATVFEGYDYVAYVLLQLIVYRMDLTTENLNRAKAGAMDVQEQVQ